MGGKGSGRRSGEPSEERTWGEGTTRRTITTEKVIKEKPVHPVVKALDKALADSEDMDVTEFFHATFDAGADAVWIMRLLPNGEEVKVGTLKRDTPYPQDDVETFLLSQYGGPGSFVLKPAVKTSYGGMFRVSKQKRVRLGVSSEADGGLGSGVSQDADTLITRALAREDKMHALSKIQELNARSAGTAKEGGDEMKTDELLTVVRELKGSDKTSEILLEMLRTERQERAAQLAASTQKNPLDLLVPIMTPLLGFLDKKLSPGTVTKWIELIRNPSPAATPEEPGIVSSVVGLLKEYAPMLQPIIANAVQSMVAQGPHPTVQRHLAPVPTAAVAPPSTAPPGDEDMATREYDDKDTQEVLDYVITCLDAHKFPEAWAALRTCDDTVDAIAPIVPGAEPMAFYFRVKDLDERLRERKDTVLEFIAYMQKQVQVLIDAQAAQQGGGAAPADTPPAA